MAPRSRKQLAVAATRRPGGPTAPAAAADSDRLGGAAPTENGGTTVQLRAAGDGPTGTGPTENSA